VSATIRARRALTAAGWRDNVAVRLEEGRIAEILEADGPADADVLLPAPGNLHSHAFQRAMAGLTETATGGDDFWSWRALMYRFLEALDPDDIEILAAGVQMEMLEAGYASVGEFHYLHHPPGGGTYANPAETGARIAAAAARTGIGLTLLPVLYMRGGLDGRPLEGGQLRFGSTPEVFERILERSREALAPLGPDARLGLAPHSLRAVDDGAIAMLAAREGPKHIHAAEQTAEVEAVRAHTGAPPLAHLARLVALGPDWTVIHATHGTAGELAALAAAGTTVGLCPITEANLGDGVFDAPAFLGAGGRFGVGSDSNVRIALAEELRTLDYGQRLALRVRNPLAPEARSSGRLLLEGAARGAAVALGGEAGDIAPGRLADLVALDGSAIALDGLSGDRLLDAFVFAGDDGAVRDVWSAGRHLVKEGRHVARDALEPPFRAALTRLRALL